MYSQAVKTLAAAVEVTLLPHGWVISPAADWALKEPLASDPLICALAYALAERASAEVMLWSAVPPWIFLFAGSAGRFQMIMFTCGQRLASMRPSTPEREEKAPGPASHYRFPAAHDSSSLWSMIIFAMVMPTAWCNAAFLLLAQRLKTNEPAHWTTVLALATYLVSWLGDFVIGCVSRKGWHAAVKSLRHTAYQVLSLALLLTVRGGIMLLGGSPALMSLDQLDGDQWRERFDSERHEALRQGMSSHPSWLSPLLSSLSLLCTVGLLVNAYMSERREKEKPVADA